MSAGLFEPQSYTIAVKLMLHLLGAIYFFSFGAFLFQIKGLLGKNGILPVVDYLRAIQIYAKKSRYFYYPSLFWINSSDTMLLVIPALGTLLGLLLFIGIFPPIVLLCLIVLHLSILSVGQDFLSFGWEGFLLELSYNAFFLSLTNTPNLFVWISLNFLIFRFHFEAGTSKLESRDPNWRNLTAIKFHYQSQPIPNTIAWYIHKLPLIFHKASTFMMFFTELVVPFFALFGNAESRLIAFVFLFGLQFFIWSTGNFSYLNHLTVVLIIPLIANKYLTSLFSIPQIEPTNFYLEAMLSIAGLSLILLQIIAMWNHYFPNMWTRKITRQIYHLHLANRYGIFAIMTTTRYEIVLEGSDDGQEWKEYEFYYKPSKLNRRPRRISPYQPRIDWQAWFLPFQDYDQQDWFQNLIVRILQGTPEVLTLLKYNPFPDKPPRYMKAETYIYEFTDFKTKTEKKCWWKRSYVGPYSPTVQLYKYQM